MTAPRPSDELEGERAVDLARWRRSLVALWWIPIAGLVVGAIAGVLYSFRGGNTYQASALISLGQPLSPGGSLIPSYGTNPRAVSQITSSAFAQAQAAAKAHMRPSALRGHVSIAQVGTATGAGATRATPLVSLTVTGSRPKHVAAAANELAGIVVESTTASYVGVKVHTIQRTLNSIDDQLSSVNARLQAVEQALRSAKSLDLVDRLLLVTQDDAALARQGNLLTQQGESAKVVEPARATKSSARSRNTSLVVGAIIGLVLGAILAIVVDARRPVRV